MSNGPLFPHQGTTSLREWPTESRPAAVDYDATTPLTSGPVSPLSASLKLTLPQGTELRGARHNFILERALGAGGMGAVYLARNTRPTNTLDGSAEAVPEHVAIKVFKGDWGISPADLLKRELSAMRALRHPRIPAVYDWALHGEQPFVAFAYQPGGSLADLIARRGQLPIDCCYRLLEDLLSALAAAHRAALLHLDVKPGNVLIGTDGHYLLSDFGISQGFLVSRAVVSTGLGAPVFQSPEQRRADAEAFDERTDLWGAGITVWTALTGAHPLDLRNLLEACTVGDTGLPSPSAIRPDCPPNLEAALMPLLSLDPDKRPGSAAEALTILRRHHPALSTDTSPLIQTPQPVSNTNASQRDAIFDNLMDPLWRSICKSGEVDDRLVEFKSGDVLCREGEESYRTFVLLHGAVCISRSGQPLHREDREGAFLGEVTCLIGANRSATMIADGDTWVFALNPAQLERFVTRNPAVAIRLMKVLAERLHRESEMNRLGKFGQDSEI